MKVSAVIALVVAAVVLVLVLGGHSAGNRGAGRHTGSFGTAAAPPAIV